MMNRILRSIFVFISFILVAHVSVHAVAIQTAGGTQIANVDEPVVCLWTGLMQDLDPAGAVRPAPLLGPIALPAAPVVAPAGTGVDYAPINNIHHPAAIILAELQTIHALSKNKNLFLDIVKNESAIVHHVSEVRKFAPQAIPIHFEKGELKAHPKKKYYNLAITQNRINPQDVYPYLKAAFDFGFADPVKSGLAQLYAQAMLATMREMNDTEDEIDFLSEIDVSQMDQDKIQDFTNLDEADASQCALKNEIKRQYLFQYGRWLDGRGINVSGHGVLDENVCHEVEWLIKVGLIPAVITTPIAPVKTIDQLAQHFFKYFSSWKTYMKKQIVPGILGGISNPLWQTTLWVNYLPQELRKEIEKLHITRYNKLLAPQRIENLNINDLVELRDSGRIPHFVHAPVTTTFRTIAKEWVQRNAVASVSSYFASKQWSIVNKNNEPADWLQILPTELVHDVCRYYHCAVIKHYGKWVDIRHLHGGKSCGDLPIGYLTQYGILPLPKDVTQQAFEACTLEQQARHYANTYVALNKLGHKKKIINQISYMPHSFKTQVCRQYMLVTAHCGALLHDKAVFKPMYDDKDNHKDLQITLTDALLNDDVKKKIAQEIKKDGTLNLSNMFLSALTAADLAQIALVHEVQLDNITHLNLSHNRLVQFSDDIINQLPNLEVLDLSYNHLETLPVGLFAPGANTRLKNIYLNNNRIERLPLALFRELYANAAIDSIDLSHNQLNADYVPYCGSLKVKSLNLSNNGLTHLQETLFNSTATNNRGAPPAIQLDHTFRNNIEEINLSCNKLKIIQNNNTKKALASLTDGSIKLLNLQDNLIDKVHPILHCKLNSLEHLLLDHNNIIAIKHGDGAGITPNMENLITLSLSHNQLDKIYLDDCTWFPNLKRLDLSSNRIQTIEEEVAPLGGSALSCLAKLEVLLLDNNQIEVLTVKTFQKLEKLKIMHLAGNKIIRFRPNVFRGLQDLEELYLYANSATFSFDDQPAAPDTTIDVGAFDGLVKLSYLDLSFNRIKKLDRKAFRGLSELTHLNLGHNKIQSISSNLFDPLSELHYLDLSQNRLNNVCAQAFDNLKRCKVIRFKGNNASGFFKLFSHRRLMYQERSKWLLGRGSQLDIEALNRYIGVADLARLWKALGRNKALGVPGLRYLVRFIIEKKAEVINRSVESIKAPDTSIKLSNIAEYFTDYDKQLKQIAFDQDQAKVKEEVA